jgi:hypothetical protein
MSQTETCWFLIDVPLDKWSNCLEGLVCYYHYCISCSFSSDCTLPLKFCSWMSFVSYSCIITRIYKNEFLLLYFYRTSLNISLPYVTGLSAAKRKFGYGKQRSFSSHFAHIRYCFKLQMSMYVCGSFACIFVFLHAMFYLFFAMFYLFFVCDWKNKCTSLLQ